VVGLLTDGNRSVTFEGETSSKNCANCTEISAVDYQFSDLCSTIPIVAKVNTAVDRAGTAMNEFIEDAHAFLDPTYIKQDDVKSLEALKNFQFVNTNLFPETEVVNTNVLPETEVYDTIVDDHNSESTVAEYDKRNPDNGHPEGSLFRKAKKIMSKKFAAKKNR